VSTVLLRCWCNAPKKAHQLAKVLAGRDGHTVEITEAVREVDGWSRRRHVVALDGLEGRQLACPCGKEFPLWQGELRQAIAARQHTLILQPWGVHIASTPLYAPGQDLAE
jgi:hypothetical protein